MDRRQTDRRQNQSDDIYIPDIADILKILNKRKIQILLVIIIPTVVAFLFLKSKANIYRATSSVILETQNINLSDYKDILQSTKFDDLTVPTQIQVITSTSLAKKTIAALSIMQDASGQVFLGDEINGKNLASITVTDFLERLDVKQQGTSRAINISFDAQNPGIAAKIVNTHTRIYTFSQIQSKKERAARINRWISEQIETLKQESLSKSKAVQEFKSQNGMVQGLNSQDLIYQQISDIAKQLSPIETKELDLKARVELLKSGKQDTIKEIIESELIQRLKSRASEISQNLKSIQSDLGKNHPDVISKRKELNQINSDIRAEVSNIRKSIENELTTTVNQKKLLKTKLEELQEKANILQEKQIELQSLEISEAASRKQLDNFFARSEEIKSQTDFTRSDITIVSEADIPNEPKGSKKTIILVAVCFLSAGLALAITLLLETLDKGITRKEDVKRILNVPLLGVLPKEKHPITRILSKQRSVYTEEIKRIYIHLSSKEGIKTVLFTSARKNEGKTMTAVALAYFLGTIGKKVLLIDANTVKPNISDITNTRTEPGFYELLAKECAIKDAIITDKHGLSVIPAGGQIAYSSDFLLANAFDEHLEQLKKSYDHIIIDSAPANETSDAEVLARLCDHTIILCTWGKTSKRTLKEVTESLRSISQNMLSIVLNKVPASEIKNK